MEETASFDGIIGIDPGKAGAVVFWKPGSQVKVWKMPDNVKGYRLIFNYVQEVCRTPICFIERQALHNTDIGGKQFNIIKLLANYNNLKTTLELSDIPIYEVGTRTWMKYCQLTDLCLGMEKKDRKSFFKQKAAERFPGIKVTLWNCDALLILEAGRFLLKFKPKEFTKFKKEKGLL